MYDPQKGASAPPSPTSIPPTQPGELRLDNAHRPVWPTVLGIIAIVFASLGLITRIGGLLVMLLFRTVLAGFVDEFDMTSAGAFADHWVTWTTLEYILGAILAAWLLIAGIGLIKRRRWSIAATIAWAWAKIVFAFGESILGYYVQRDQFEAMQQQAPGGGMPAGMDTTLLLIGVATSLLIGIAFPIACLIVLNLKSSRREYATWQ